MIPTVLSHGLRDDFHSVMLGYFEKDHAETVSTQDLKKPVNQVYYLPVHVVYKQSNSTSKVRVVFDASAPSSTGMSLNNTLLVRPMTHSSLFDVLLQFRLYRIALTTDISRMYRDILLDCSDKDLYRFVWRAAWSLSAIAWLQNDSNHIWHVCFIIHRKHASNRTHMTLRVHTPWLLESLTIHSTWTTASLMLIQWMKRLSSRSKCKGCSIMVGLHWENGTLVTPRCSPIFQMSSKSSWNLRAS